MKGGRGELPATSAAVQTFGRATRSPAKKDSFLQMHSKSVRGHPDALMASRTGLCCEGNEFGLLLKED